MSWNYNSWLKEQLNRIISDNDLDIIVTITDEQSFVKMNKLEPNNVYIVIKYLSADISFEGKTQPVQFMILSEQNNLTKVKNIFNIFSETYNWKVVEDGNEYIKHSYNSPVVLSNFNEVGFGYRSVLYMSGNLYMLKDILDVKEITIDGISFKPLSFTMSYIMSGNSQQLTTDYLMTTVKSEAGLSISLSIAMLDIYKDENNNLVEKIMSIAEGKSDGNADFDVSFSIGEKESLTLERTMKLISVKFDSAPGSVPSLLIQMDV